MLEDGRQQGLPAGAAHVLFWDCARARRVTALGDCSVRAVLAYSVANERTRRGVRQRSRPSHRNDHDLGTGPFSVPQSVPRHPQDLLFQESLLLSCPGCRGGLTPRLGQGQELQP